MDRQTIIDEIKRTAAENGGKPLGTDRFRTATGIRSHEWQKHWARFSDALRDAGFAPNKFNKSGDENVIIARIAELARELGRFPTSRDMLVKRTNDATFPGNGTFEKYGKHRLARVVAAFCSTNPGYDDVSALCPELQESVSDPDIKPNTSNDGFVYLIKSGRHYKIGKTNSVGRRERELTIQLPEQVKTVHSIRTDHPTGIEAYWHRRFESKRQNGEWFDLSVEDVSAFRRRKFM